MAYEDIIKRAKEAAAQENYDYAITLLYDIVRADAKNRQARAMLHEYEVRKAQRFGQSAAAKVGGFMRGLASRFGKKDPLKMINNLEGALKGSPTNVALMLQLASALNEAGLPEHAIDLLEVSRMLDNKNKDALRELVDLYDSMKNYERAQARASDYMKLDPHDQTMAVRLKDVSAKRHMEMSKIQDAQRFLDQVKDLKQAEDLERQQRLVMDEGEIAEGIRKAQIAIRRDPKDHIAYVKLGDLIQRKGDLMKAMKCYQAAYKIAREYPTREKMGNLAMRIYQEGMKQAEERLAQNPDDPQLKEGYEKEKQRYLSGSLKEYESRVKNHPTDLGLRFRLAMAFYENELYDKAVAEFQNTVQDPKVRRESQKYLGLSFMKKNMPDLAVNQFQIGLKNLKPGDTESEKELNYYLALAYEQMGDAERAYEIFQRIFQADISYKDVAQKMSDLRVKVKGG